MFWNNLIDLCNKKGTTPTALVNTLKIATGSVTKWKNGAVPRTVTLQKIADYFNVSVDYLLGKEQEKKTSSKVLTPAVSLSPRETAVIIAYRTHPNEQAAVDKLLDVPTTPEEITLYVAAYSSENTPDGLITVPKSEWDQLKAIPATDQDLS